MRPSELLLLNKDAIIRTVIANHFAEPKVFGSVLLGEDTELSDLDILVYPTERSSLLSLARLSRQLSELLGIRVDVATPKSLPTAWRRNVISAATPI